MTIAQAQTILFSGQEAYEKFQSIYVGIANPRKIDKDSSGDISRAWDRYEKKNPERSKILWPFIKELARDGKKIKHSLLEENLRQPTLQNIAAERSGLSPDKTALIIGGEGELTFKMITALGHSKKCNPRKIFLTHPDSLKQKSLFKRASELEGFKKLSVELCVQDQEKAMSETLNKAGAVFVCLPTAEEKSELIGLDPYNELLFSVWQRRKERNLGDKAKIIFLKGTHCSQEEKQETWSELSSMGYISSNELGCLHNEQKGRIKQVREKTLEAISFFGKLRLDGNRRVKNVFLDLQTMEIKVEELILSAVKAQAKVAALMRLESMKL